MLFNLSCSQLENGLVLHSNQTDIYLKSIVIGQKSTSQIAQNIYMVESWCDFRMLSLTSGTFGGPSRVFREYSDIVEKDIFLDVSGFLYSRGWQVWTVYKQSINVMKF